MPQRRMYNHIILFQIGSYINVIALILPLSIIRILICRKSAQAQLFQLSYLLRSQNKFQQFLVLAKNGLYLHNKVTVVIILNARINWFCWYLRYWDFMPDLLLLRNVEHRSPLHNDSGFLMKWNYSKIIVYSNYI